MKRGVFNFFPLFALLLAALAVLAACSERPLKIQLRYDQIFGLTKEDGVFFERNRVGQVENVSYRATGDYLVVITIIPEFMNAATEQSQFYIGTEPGNGQNRAVIITQEQLGGKILQEGTVVEGAVRQRYLEELLGDISERANEVQSELEVAMEELRKSFTTTSQKIDAELQRSITDLSLKLETLQDEAERLPERPEVKQLQETFQEFAEQFDQAQEDVRSYLRDTLLPRLKVEMDVLRERLKENGREDELEKIDKKLEEMSVI